MQGGQFFVEGQFFAGGLFFDGIAEMKDALIGEMNFQLKH